MFLKGRWFTGAGHAPSRGADVKVVQQMLRHSSATMTLDAYGHLFQDRLDEVGDAMDRVRTASRQRHKRLALLPRVARALSLIVSVLAVVLFMMTPR